MCVFVCMLYCTRQHDCAFVCTSYCRGQTAGSAASTSTTTTGSSLTTAHRTLLLNRSMSMRFYSVSSPLFTADSVWHCCSSLQYDYRKTYITSALSLNPEMYWIVYFCIWANTNNLLCYSEEVTNTSCKVHGAVTATSWSQNQWPSALTLLCQ